MADNLKNPPLVEALFELRWKLIPLGVPVSQGIPANAPMAAYDPNYKFLVGPFYNSIRNKYPIVEQFPTAVLPEDMVAYTPQYRFRIQKDSWPLVQLGPGLLSYNSTREYEWGKFLNESSDIVKNLYAAYLNSPSGASPMKIERLSLQYINAFPFDFAKDNALEFLKRELNFTIEPMPKLFDEENVINTPLGFSNSIGFPVQNPKGTILINYGTGIKDNSQAIFWNIELSSHTDSIPSMPEHFREWIESAHNVIETCFFKSLSPELMSSFQEGVL